MKSDKLKNQVLSIFEEIKQDNTIRLTIRRIEVVRMLNLAKYLMQQVKTWKVS